MSECILHEASLLLPFKFQWFLFSSLSGTWPNGRFERTQMSVGFSTAAMMRAASRSFSHVLRMLMIGTPEGRDRLLNNILHCFPCYLLQNLQMYCIAGNFQGENFCKFHGFVAICESFNRENCIIHQFAKVFSLESFPLYSMIRLLANVCSASYYVPYGSYSFHKPQKYAPTVICTCI